LGFWVRLHRTKNRLGAKNAAYLEAINLPGGFPHARASMKNARTDNKRKRKEGKAPLVPCTSSPSKKKRSYRSPTNKTKKKKQVRKSLGPEWLEIGLGREEDQIFTCGPQRESPGNQSPKAIADRGGERITSDQSEYAGGGLKGAIVALNYERRRAWGREKGEGRVGGDWGIGFPCSI